VHSQKRKRSTHRKIKKPKECYNEKINSKFPYLDCIKIAKNLTILSIMDPQMRGIKNLKIGGQLKGLDLFMI